MLSGITLVFHYHLVVFAVMSVCLSEGLFVLSPNPSGTRSLIKVLCTIQKNTIQTHLCLCV